MGLTRYKLGELIELLNEQNTNSFYEVKDVRGVNNLKKFISTKADLNGRDLSKFQVVKPGDFVFNHRTSRNGGKFSIAYNDIDMPVICTEDYVVFKIRNESKNIILDRWLYIYFNRDEFDRYVITNSWGSSTEFYNWNDICDIDIDLPPIEIQQKYVDIYNSMLANQQCYERGLEDLKMVCDAYVEKLRKETEIEPLGLYIEGVCENNNELAVTQVKGVEASGSFMATKANMQGVDIGKYTIVRKGCIAYNPSRINIGSIALYTENDPCVISPMYIVFKVKEKCEILPEYLMLWFRRKEFQRYTWFNAAGSVRDTFDFNLMCEVGFPFPNTEIQRDIVNIYNVYLERKAINEKLKAQIKDICPILIKGSLEEASR